MRLFVIVVALSLGSGCLAQQTPAPVRARKPPQTAVRNPSRRAVVSEAPDDAFRAAYTPQQRLGLETDSAAFSPDGRYLALVVGDIVTGDPEQAWRYDLSTHQFLAITATPTEENMKFVNGIAWVGDTLYTAGDALAGSISRPYFVRTEGDTTSRIASSPPDVQWPDYNLPRKVGRYAIDGTPITAAVTRLFMSPSRAPIAEVFWDWWVTLDDPPTVIFATGSINVFYLSTRHMQHIAVPTNYDLEVLAALRIPNGFRVAYTEQGSCTIAGSSLNQALPRHLCFVDIPEETGPNRPRHPAKK